MASTTRTFTAKQVCAALEIPRGTLNAWAHSGYLFGFDAEFTRPGKARLYSFDDIFRLSIMKSLLNYGISLAEARSISTLCVHFYNEKSPSKVRFICAGHFRGVLTDDEPFELLSRAGERPRPPGEEIQPELEIVVYPRQMIRQLKAQLDTEPPVL